MRKWTYKLNFLNDQVGKHSKDDLKQSTFSRISKDYPIKKNTIKQTYLFFNI